MKLETFLRSCKRKFPNNVQLNASMDFNYNFRPSFSRALSQFFSKNYKEFFRLNLNYNRLSLKIFHEPRIITSCPLNCYNFLLCPGLTLAWNILGLTGLFLPCTRHSELHISLEFSHTTNLRLAPNIFLHGFIWAKTKQLMNFARIAGLSQTFEDFNDLD